MGSQPGSRPAGAGRADYARLAQHDEDLRPLWTLAVRGARPACRSAHACGADRCTVELSRRGDSGGGCKLLSTSGRGRWRRAAGADTSGTGRRNRVGRQHHHAAVGARAVTWKGRTRVAHAHTQAARNDPGAAHHAGVFQRYDPRNALERSVLRQPGLRRRSRCAHVLWQERARARPGRGGAAGGAHSITRGVQPAREPGCGPAAPAGRAQSDAEEGFCERERGATGARRGVTFRRPRPDWPSERTRSDCSALRNVCAQPA